MGKFIKMTTPPGRETYKGEGVKKQGNLNLLFLIKVTHPKTPYIVGSSYRERTYCDNKVLSVQD